MSLDRASQELRVTLAELSFRNEASATVLELAALELPPGQADKVREVIKLLRADAGKIRILAERTQAGQIAVLQ
ncbi:hypothetical protein [Pseudomonas sp. Pseusp97]|uniref:hypothetical protein n=1 Tax=Pseudomonas sp. Pseusp97 TaxID=3243065 RepID=UPI0039A6451E